MVGKELKEFRNSRVRRPDRAAPHRARRRDRSRWASTPSSQRFDVLFVGGIKSAVDKVGALLGKIARPSTSTDLLTLVARHDPRLPDRRHHASRSPAPRSASATPAACWCRASSCRRSRRACASSATRRTRRATSSRISGWWCSSPSSASTPAPALISQLTGAVALKIFIAGFIVTHHPADPRLGDRLPHDEDQSGGADGRRRGRALALRARRARRPRRSAARCRGSASRWATPCPACC